jgi:hypothetical protein
LLVAVILNVPCTEFGSLEAVLTGTDVVLKIHNEGGCPRGAGMVGQAIYSLVEIPLSELPRQPNVLVRVDRSVNGSSHLEGYASVDLSDTASDPQQRIAEVAHVVAAARSDALARTMTTNALIVGIGTHFWSDTNLGCSSVGSTSPGATTGGPGYVIVLRDRLQRYPEYHAVSSNVKFCRFLNL